LEKRYSQLKTNAFSGVQLSPEKNEETAPIANEINPKTTAYFHSKFKLFTTSKYTYPIIPDKKAIKKENH